MARPMNRFVCYFLTEGEPDAILKQVRVANKKDVQLVDSSGYETGTRIRVTGYLWPFVDGKTWPHYLIGHGNKTRMEQLARLGNPPFKDLAYTRKNILPLLGVNRLQYCKLHYQLYYQLHHPLHHPLHHQLQYEQHQHYLDHHELHSDSSQRSDVQMQDNPDSLFFNNQTLPSDSLLDVTF